MAIIAHPKKIAHPNYTNSCFALLVVAFPTSLPAVARWPCWGLATALTLGLLLLQRRRRLWLRLLLLLLLLQLLLLKHTLFVRKQQRFQVLPRLRLLPRRPNWDNGIVCPPHRRSQLIRVLHGVPVWGERIVFTHREHKLPARSFLCQDPDWDAQRRRAAAWHEANNKQKSKGIDARGTRHTKMAICQAKGQATTHKGI